jgi:hypothetical protein
MKWDILCYGIVGILHSIADWYFAKEFNPDMTTKMRVISAIKLGVLWPLYWLKVLLEEFL